MKIKLDVLNDALNFVKAGLSPNSYLQIATTVTFLAQDGDLYFITEPDDGEVKYQVNVCKTDLPNGTAVAVNGFQFTQAVGTCTNPEVELVLEEDKVSLDNGRGALYLPILVDDDGNPVANTLGAVSGTDVEVKNPDSLRMMTACLSTSMDNIAIRNIYCSKGVTLASDLVNIAKAGEVIGEEMLVTQRMREFLLKYSDCKFKVSDEFLTLVSENKVALFTKGFQAYLEEFPVDALNAEFEQTKQHSFTIDMEQFLNALSFLRVATNSVNDYAVTLRANGPDSIELESDHGSKQLLKVNWLTPENGPWEISFDCVSALARFAFADGVRRIDVYDTMISCVGAIEVALGLIIDEET